MTRSALEVANVLTERPEMLRRLIFDQVQTSSTELAAVIEADRYAVRRGRLGKMSEKAIRARLDELRECMVLLEQLGWR